MRVSWMPPAPMKGLRGAGKFGWKTLATAVSWFGLSGLTDSGSSPWEVFASLVTLTMPVSPAP